jgi:hypothetical protein
VTVRVYEGATRYVAVYELDADDLDAVLQQIVDRVGDGRIEMSDAMEMDPVPSTLLYTLRD